MSASIRGRLRELYDAAGVLDLPLYSAWEAARYARVPENTLRSWVSGRSYRTRRGMRKTSPLIHLRDPVCARLSFLNLVEVHILDALRRQYRVELPQIRRALDYLGEHFRTPHPLVHREMLTDGRHLFVEGAGLDGPAEGRELINASRHGQLAMRDLVELHLQRVEWDRNGLAARFFPFVGRRQPADDVPKWITMDPRVAFGRPALVSSGIPTAVIADRFNAGESVDDLADDYGEDRLRIQEAIRCEFESRPRAA